MSKKYKGLKRTPRDKTLDDLQRRYIRLISGGYCKRCGEYVGERMIEVAHIYRRNRKTVRWDFRNVYPLCKDNPLTGRKGCHYQLDSDPIKMASFLYDVLTTEEVEDLQRLANMTIKDYPIDREKIKAELKEKIRLLEV
ncbi:hypothetical protein LCGC14_2426180 [marine sediment metagenome]|uniref:HNH nuclease domain-containing protein n=1 Tax=marine sediment metagenome TaxID=412755 RepID=A0A0F9BNC3_9ZZZZ